MQPCCASSGRSVCECVCVCCVVRVCQVCIWKGLCDACGVCVCRLWHMECVCVRL